MPTSRPHWTDSAIFYHLYPLGCLGAPARNPFSGPPARRLGALHGWLDHLADLGRLLVSSILATPCRSDRLGQSVRNLFECLGLPEEGATLSLECGERPDSPLR